jgi:glucose/arabinose dehydrogenase
MRKKTKAIFLSLILIVLIGVIMSIGGIFFLKNDSDYSYKPVNAFPNLTFDEPVGIYSADDDNTTLYVVEQAGIIKSFKNEPNATESKIFLNITDRVDSSGYEEGLLGLAFHPNFSENGRFYVDYTNLSGFSIISQFTLNSSDPTLANKSSESRVLAVQQPYDNHNGGQLAFGPEDGYLYISLGDGGGAGDPERNAQNKTTLLGSILRIDVDTGDPYSIPEDNPFYGNTEGYKGEIFAYGLRNPWRFSFDNETDLLWAADVGQNSWEEIDLIENGGNYGWPILEGDHCYNSLSCDKTGYISPIYEYSHDYGRSITGGFVYRGSNLPALVGKYIYGDYVSGTIWALEYTGDKVSNNEALTNLSYKITSFGLDANKELLICTLEGFIYELENF